MRWRRRSIHLGPLIWRTLSRYVYSSFLFEVRQLIHFLLRSRVDSLNTSGLHQPSTIFSVVCQLLILASPVEQLRRRQPSSGSASTVLRGIAAQVRFSSPSHGRLRSLTVAFNHLADQQDLTPFLQEFTNLSALLDAVVGSLPSLDPQAIVRVQNPELARRLCVAYTILNAAIMRLHAPFAFSGRSETSHHKRLTAARSVLHIILAVRGRGPGYLNPIVGVGDRCLLRKICC